MFYEAVYDNNIRIELPRHNLSYDLARRAKSEPGFRQIHTALINAGIIKGNFIDAGCWIGDNTIPWAVNISHKIYAFDPSPENLNFICSVCELNKIQNVELYPYALSEKVEVLKTKDNLFHASFIYENNPNGVEKSVRAVSLDWLYENKKVQKIGYIHLDVEGMELKVLKGGSKLIEDLKPVISFEQHLEIDPVKEAIDFLKGKGYFVYLINEVLEGCRPDCRNFLATPFIFAENALKELKLLVPV